MPSPGASDQFGALYIKTGHFDRLLLRPRSTILQLAGHELALRRIGRFVQGLIVLVWAASMLNVEWSVCTHEFGALYDPRWGLFVLWAHCHASDAGVLDHRNPRNHEYVNLRGCGVCPISHGHLSTLPFAVSLPLWCRWRASAISPWWGCWGSLIPWAHPGGFNTLHQHSASYF